MRAASQLTANVRLLLLALHRLPSMSRTAIRLTHARMLFIAAVVAILLSLRSLGPYLFVDSCLHAGGMMNYDEWMCVTRGGIPNPRAFAWVRAPTWVGVATAAFAVVIILSALAAFDWWKRKSSPPAV